MDVLPQILSDADFLYFDEEIYAAFSRILNDVICKYISTYMQSGQAIPEVVDAMQKYLGQKIEILSFPQVLKDKGILDYVTNLVPETLPGGDIDLDETVSKLSYLQDNIGKVTTVITQRTAEDYNSFLKSMIELTKKMNQCGKAPTYGDLLRRIEANKFLFYTRNEKSRNNGLGIISSRKKKWTIALWGARYIQECDKRGIQTNSRRRF